eukprot:scaffold51692_cov35-Prasinocladus_malaysianus.AAC.1
MHYAAEVGGPSTQNQLQEVLFRQFFTEGVFPDKEGLQQAAEEAGLNPDEALAYAEDIGNQRLVLSEISRVRELGIRAVPFLCVNGIPIFNGLYASDSLLKVLKMAHIR